MVASIPIRKVARVRPARPATQLLDHARQRISGKGLSARMAESSQRRRASAARSTPRKIPRRTSEAAAPFVLSWS
jgi:hypothetical protein